MGKIKSAINNTYEVIYASDDSFVKVMGISIISLLENNKKHNFRISVLDSEISNQNKRLINKIIDSYENVVLRFVKINNVETELGVRLYLDRGSISQYYRLFIADIFKGYNGRVLYLDCDTVIVDDIQELMTLDLSNNVIAALKDAFSRHYRKNIELKDNDIMFNSGVMLIDLKKWREEDIENRIIVFLKKYKGKVQQGDQGVLNAVLSSKTATLSPKFNLVSIFYDLNYEQILSYRKPVNFYSENEIKVSKKTPIIIHYTSSFYSLRPWEIGCRHKMKAYWNKYKIISPWKMEENSKNKSFVKLIIRVLPFGIVLKMAGFLQQVLRPLFFKVNFLKTKSK